jgi:hypothetical protein
MRIVKPFSKEHKEKISNSLKGKRLGKHSSIQTEFKEGHKSFGGFVKGSKHSQKTKDLLSKIQTGKVGPLAGNWRGGKTIVRKMIPAIDLYKIWRSSVFERDNWTCQTCRERGCYIEAHHIVPLAIIIDRYKLKTRNDCINCLALWDLNNSVTLCFDCHNLTKKGKTNE